LSKKQQLRLNQEASSSTKLSNSPKKKDAMKNVKDYYDELSDEAFIEEVLSDSNLDRITANLFR